MGNNEDEGSSKEGIGSKIWKHIYKRVGDDPEQTPGVVDPKPAPTTTAKKIATRPMVIRTVMGPGATTPTFVPRTYSASGPQQDPNMRVQLEQAMLGDNDNSVGQLLAMMSSLAEDIAEPAKLLRAALKALKGQGCTPEKILADIASDEAILTSQETGFKDYSASEREKRLGSKQKEMEAVSATIGEKSEQIAKLQGEIAELTSHQGALQSETETEARNISDVEARFAATLAAIRVERSDLKTRIETQGKGV